MENKNRDFAGVTWNRQAANRDDWRRLGWTLSCSGLIGVGGDNDKFHLDINCINHTVITLFRPLHL